VCVCVSLDGVLQEQNNYQNSTLMNTPAGVNRAPQPPDRPRWGTAREGQERRQSVIEIKKRMQHM